MAREPAMTNAVGGGTVQWELDGRGVGTVTLNRPEVNNAYNGDLIRGVHEALDALGASPALRVVVLRGNGKHFQAGADLTWLAEVARQSPAENERVSQATAESVRRLDTLPLPTVALVQGGCFGGGTGFAAVCDVVVASDDAIFSISETRWGLMAGIILPQLCRAMGLRQVRRYALTGERFDAHEARRLGLVHEVCPAGTLEATGARMVDALLMNAPAATAATKLRALGVAGAFVDDAALRDLVREHAATRQLDEAAEGLASFREKRKPRWYPGSA
jgi:methylglutaconyl-CoA hydratase